MDTARRTLFPTPHSPMESSQGPLYQDMEVLQGYVPRLRPLLQRLLGGHRVLDVLWHLPTGIETLLAAPAAVPSLVGQTVQMPLVLFDQKQPRTRTQPTLIYGKDAHDTVVELVFFKGNPAYLHRAFPMGQTRFVRGKLECLGGLYRMVHPLSEGKPLMSSPWHRPTYPLCTGITPAVLAPMIRSALKSLPPAPEWLPDALLRSLGWPAFHEALRAYHHPRHAGDLDPSAPHRMRLAFDELLARFLSLKLARQSQMQYETPPMMGKGDRFDRSLAALPFSLTPCQQRALGDIETDLSSPRPMRRLLQGDVGSGKTVVAFLSAVMAKEAGYSTVLMAPTELLALQHAATLAPWAEACGLTLMTVTGKDRGRGRDQKRALLPDVDLLIGTHALLHEETLMPTLGLVVIDEQHRFGVYQRLKLAHDGAAQNLLVMTATPIPRTLQLMSYHDMTCSALRTKPPNRQPIETRTLPIKEAPTVMERLSGLVAQNQKVYWICPLIDPQEDNTRFMAATQRFEILKRHFGPRVGLLHGQMKSDQKEATLAAFAGQDLDILVSTTVIEVGIHVPEATVMIIENAEHFGLAQLHQLRGRIGRGALKSHCLLLYGPALTQTAKRRLAILRESEDGFFLAEEDLKIRGGGDVMGAEQSGWPTFRCADMNVHQDLVERAHGMAVAFVRDNPALVGQQGHALRMLLSVFGRQDTVDLLHAG
ncbi:MAG: ATP-dependent DNA helicase RecG [Alphaproteobacteria bacterium]